MKHALFILFMLGAAQAFSQQTISKERVVRPTVQPAPNGKGTEARPASTPQPATTTGQGNEQSPAQPATTTIQPSRKYVTRSTVPQKKAAPVKENP